MTDKNNLSRRDAIKILTAITGAATLSTLPAKWTKPISQAGVLPAHAQTSVIPTEEPTKEPVVLPFSILNCGDPDSVCQEANSIVTIIPPTGGITMRYTVIPSNDLGTINNPSPLTGTIDTDPSGQASLYLWFNYNTFNVDDTFTIEWSFENPDDGDTVCEQVITYNGAC